MKLRTPLGLVRGLGSAKSGTEHWWLQRVTAVALIPLSLWFIVAVLGLAGAPYAEASAWLASPLNATLTMAFVLAVFWHALLGLQVVIEDYVHCEPIKIVALVALRLAIFLLALLAGMSILRIFLGTN